MVHFVTSPLTPLASSRVRWSGYVFVFFKICVEDAYFFKSTKKYDDALTDFYYAFGLQGLFGKLVLTR